MSSARSVLITGVNGWFSANHRTQPGIHSVRAKALDMALERPRGVPLRGGARRLAVDDLRLSAADQTGWQTPDFEDSADRYDVIVTGGANELTVGSW